MSDVSAPQGAVTWDNTGDISTQSFTVPEGLTDAALVVLCAERNNTAVNGVTYNGVALTEIVQLSNGAGTRAAAFIMLNPPAGTYDLVKTLAANIQGCWWAFLAQNVHQSATIRDFDSATVAAGTTSQLTLTTEAGDLVIDFLVADNSTYTVTPDTGQTALGVANANTGVSANPSYEAAAGASTTTGATSSSAADLSHLSFALAHTAAAIVATELRVTTEPAATEVGGVMASFAVSATDASGNVDTGATGNVALTIQSGPTADEAAFTGTLTRALVNGVATFNDLTPQMIGTGWSFAAAHDGALTGDTTAVFDTSLPAGGGTTVFLGGNQMEKPMLASAGATYRTLAFQAWAADGAAVTDLGGAPVNLSINGAAAAASTNNATQVSGNRYTLEIAAAELAAAGDTVEIVTTGTAVHFTGYVSAVATADDLNAASPTDATIADAVRTELTPELAVVDALGDTLEDNAGTYRFTAAGLAQAPSGAGLTAGQEASLTAAEAAAAAAQAAAESVDAKLTALRAGYLDAIPGVESDAASAAADAALAAAASAAAELASESVDAKLTAPRALLLDNLVDLDAPVSTAGDPAANAAAVRTNLAAELALISTNLDAPVSEAGGAASVDVPALAAALIADPAFARLFIEANQSVEYERAAGAVSGYFYLLNEDGTRNGTRRTVTFASATSGQIIRISPAEAY